MQETRVRSLGQEDTLEKGMATHSSILAWRIPWTEEPIRLQSMVPQKVRHDWATNSKIGRIKLHGSQSIYEELCCSLSWLRTGLHLHNQLTPRFKGKAKPKFSFYTEPKSSISEDTNGPSSVWHRKQEGRGEEWWLKYRSQGVLYKNSPKSISHGK